MVTETPGPVVGLAGDTLGSGDSETVEAEVGVPTDDVDEEQVTVEIGVVCQELDLGLLLPVAHDGRYGLS